MNSDCQKLLLDIAKCKNFINYVDGGEFSNNCRSILESQNDEGISKDNYQVPEPWNGDIENARVLFVSSNPSIDENEIYPTLSWGCHQLVDFFSHRFDEEHHWTRDLCVMVGDTEYANKKVPYWCEINNRMREIYELEPSSRKTQYECKLGAYAAITEIVHCKSKNKNGVCQAIDECATKYLRLILENAKEAAVVVLIDSDVISYFNREIFNSYNKRIRLYGKSRCYKGEMPNTGTPNMFSIHLDSFDKEIMFISLGTAGGPHPRKICSWSDYKKQMLVKFLEEH
jgi:hypothetical protein